MDHMTAKVSCFTRAYHCKNNPVPVFADTAARQLLGEDYLQIAQSMTQGIPFFLPDFHGTPEEGLRRIVDRQLSPSVLGRSAYCERMLANEQRIGCRQYVLFASGYDTFALRNGDTSLSVYELDLPSHWQENYGKRFLKVSFPPSVMLSSGTARPIVSR